MKGMDIDMGKFINKFDGIILVAKGALTYIPYFEPFKDKLHVCWWSRFTYPSDAQWLTEKPVEKAKILLFDRSVTTGISMLRVKKWLEEQSYEVTTLGQLDPLSRLGINMIDYVFNKGVISSREQYLSENPEFCKGNYTFITFEKPDNCSAEEHQEFDKRILAKKGGMLEYQKIREIALSLNSDRDILLQCDKSWTLGELLILTHVIQKPLVTIGNSDRYDLNWDEAEEVFKNLYGYSNAQSDSI